MTGLLCGMWLLVAIPVGLYVIWGLSMMFYGWAQEIRDDYLQDPQHRSCHHVFVQISPRNIVDRVRQIGGGKTSECRKCHVIDVIDQGMMY